MTLIVLETKKDQQDIDSSWVTFPIHWREQG